MTKPGTKKVFQGLAKQVSTWMPENLFSFFTVESNQIESAVSF